MDKYDTFLKRIGAGVIDGIIFIPFSFLESVTGNSILAFFSFQLFHLAVWSLYTVGLHARFGQTLGKYVFEVKLYDINEKSTLSAKKAFLRESVWICSQGLITLYFLAAASSNMQQLEGIKASYADTAAFASLTWMLIEVVTMATNRKHRSVQDFIAGSVVLKIT